MVRSKSNNDDFLRGQISRFGSARVFLKTEIQSCLVTTRNGGAGESETGRPPGRCWSPGETAEPGGWRGTLSSARSPEPRSYKEEANSNRPIGPYKAVRYLT